MSQRNDGGRGAVLTFFFFSLCRTSSKAERLQQYLAVPSLPGITAQEEQEIDEVGSSVHYRNFVSLRGFVLFAL